ncbi:MAG: carboxypeptidase-like regulatory domain-containing protein [Thermoguttaceae bacterium]
MLNNNLFRAGVSFLIVFVLLTFAGCNKGPALQKVTGKVLMDGEPLSNASVNFHAQAGGRPSGGTTNADGVFTLEYVDRTGAIAGEYTVTVTTAVPDPNATGLVILPETVPFIYTKPDTSPIKKTVEKGKNDITIELSSTP